ncbi:MAG: hypothetical protein AAB974_02785 [Patescibacteria group bacterium]
MPSIGSVFRIITGTQQRLLTETELVDAAIATHPAAQRTADDADYRGLFIRLATLSLRAYREGTPLFLTVTEDERLLMTIEIGQIVAAVTFYIQKAFGLHAEPHLQISMHPPQDDAIEIRVSP